MQLRWLEPRCTVEETRSIYSLQVDPDKSFWNIVLGRIEIEDLSFDIKSFLYLYQKHKFIPLHLSIFFAEWKDGMT